jgi:hypothetical protein
MEGWVRSMWVIRLARRRTRGMAAPITATAPMTMATQP